MFVIEVISHLLLSGFFSHGGFIFLWKGFRTLLWPFSLLIEHNKAYFILIKMIICMWNYLFYRFGKPLVIDMGSIDMFHVITTQVNNLQAGLMDKILDKSILLEEK